MLLAQAYGVAGIRVTREDQIEDAIKQARAINDRPVLIEVVVSPDAMVFPMVPAGKSNDQVIYSQTQTVEWEG